MPKTPSLSPEIDLGTDQRQKVNQITPVEEYMDSLKNAQKVPMIAGLSPKKELCSLEIAQQVPMVACFSKLELGSLKNVQQQQVPMVASLSPKLYLGSLKNAQQVPMVAGLSPKSLCNIETKRKKPHLWTAE